MTRIFLMVRYSNSNSNCGLKSSITSSIGPTYLQTCHVCNGIQPKGSVCVIPFAKLIKQGSLSFEQLQSPHDNGDHISSS